MIRMPKQTSGREWWTRKIVDVHQKIIDYLGDIDLEERESGSDTKESDSILNDKSLDLVYNTEIMSRANLFWQVDRQRQDHRFEGGEYHKEEAMWKN